MKQSLEVKIKAAMSFCLVMVMVSFYVQSPDPVVPDASTVTQGKGQNSISRYEQTEVITDMPTSTLGSSITLNTNGGKEGNTSVALSSQHLEHLEVLPERHIADIETIHKSGLPHMGCWVHIISPDGDILMSERSSQSHICPKTLSSMGEHMKINETADACALRCVREEGGFDSKWLPEDYGLVLESTRSFWFNRTYPADLTKDNIARTDLQYTYEYRLVADKHSDIDESASFFKAKSFTLLEELDSFVFMSPKEIVSTPVDRFCGAKFLDLLKKVLREYNSR
ncbi:hypothetical protein SARC_06093 [Sphaeroforma arctica JP610]|uniref:Nudix hydrolase domain-containing protein n=1 Tax=Sphaeroforma arctica JP610 TaxID=667725 RepID=A0A0L0FXQ7_9EUKA|nr:hypothetical protein SARC_06093 [Sphaeroforma arctica JP610]KNC81592.1 hypothetical protein SARC_06093 [Sphaeroforma arctica JP610]|eukprot:XP_014155494.1 hypothetical protein SARC_06093 [Sphaeroforma arctica JP610]